GLPGEVEQERAAALAFKIYRNAALSGVEHGQRHRRLAAAAVAQRLSARRLDLHHIGAGVCQQEAGIGAIVELAEIEDAHALERPALLLSGHLPHRSDWPRMSRAMTCFCTSLGPSPMRRMRISRNQRSSGRSLATPSAPWICIERSTTRKEASAATSLA